MRVFMMLSSVYLSGSEKNVVAVLPHLRALGVDVSLCTLSTRRDSVLAQKVEEMGIKRFDLAARRMTDPGAWRRFLGLLKRERVDVLHSEDQDSQVYGLIARRCLGTPFLMTRHVMAEPADSAWLWARAWLVFQAARFGADRVVTVSDAVKQEFARQARLPMERLETIYNGIDRTGFHAPEERKRLKSKFGWSQDRPVVIMIAVMRGGKGHEVLVEALPNILAAVPNVAVKLVGDGPEESMIRTMVEPFGDAVELLGQRSDVPDLLGASDLLVQASWAEGLPTVLIEAGAASLPVVATNVGGTAEVVLDGETGHLVPAGDAAALAARVSGLLMDPEAADRMGRKARNRVDTVFSLEEQARQTLALYERVLAER